jgi:drug/metabolite transporter (DMT)-like permease
MTYGYSLALLASVLWGLNYSLSQRALTSLPALQLYFLRSLCGTLLSAVAWVAFRRPLNQLGSVDASVLSYRLLATTLLVGTVAGIIICASIKSLNASRAAIIETSYPFFIMLFSYLLFNEAITPAVAFGGLLMFCGAAVVILWG